MDSKLSYMSIEALEQLKRDIPNVISKYESDTPFISSYFGNSAFILQSNMMIKPVTLKLPDAKSKYDLENTISLYSEMKNLKVVQAADERVWALFCHRDYWDYMRLRWPVEKEDDEEYYENDLSDGAESKSKKTRKSPKDRIMSRYFFQTNKGRSLVRNGMARLWWYGYMTYDERRSDPFELTKVLLRRHDDAQSLLERSFPHNKLILRAILSALGKHEYISRDHFRGLMRSINRIGGVTILDTMEEQNLMMLVDSKLNEVIKQTGSKKSSKSSS